MFRIKLDSSFICINVKNRQIPCVKDILDPKNDSTQVINFWLDSWEISLYKLFVCLKIQKCSSVLLSCLMFFPIGSKLMHLTNTDPSKLCKENYLAMKQFLPYMIEKNYFNYGCKMENVFITRIPTFLTDLLFKFKHYKLLFMLSFATTLSRHTYTLSRLMVGTLTFPMTRYMLTVLELDQ